jgi:hypothetical protein
MKNLNPPLSNFFVLHKRLGLAMGKVHRYFFAWEGRQQAKEVVMDKRSTIRYRHKGWFARWDFVKATMKGSRREYSSVRKKGVAREQWMVLEMEFVKVHWKSIHWVVWKEFWMDLVMVESN